jgi:ribosomal protein S18 acetylase RimI-like enzyme
MPAKSGRRPHKLPALSGHLRLKIQVLDRSTEIAYLMSEDDQEIRKATVADAPRIALMHVKSWVETYTGIIPDEILAALSVPRRTLAWENILREPAKHDGSVVYLKEVKQTIAGFGACSQQRDVDLKSQGFDGEIGAIYVLQLFQRQGTGWALMSALSCDLGSRGFRGCALWVLRENAAARHFYEKCGGEVVGERKDIRGQVVLTEVAYGWRDIKVLQQCF